MTPPSCYRLKESKTAQEQRAELALYNKVKWKRVNKALKLLAQNPRHNSLCAHKFNNLRGAGPGGEDVWVAYVENKTPGAWRIFFCYEQGTSDVIAVLSIEPHS